MFRYRAGSQACNPFNMRCAAMRCDMSGRWHTALSDEATSSEEANIVVVPNGGGGGGGSLAPLTWLTGRKHGSKV